MIKVLKKDRNYSETIKISKNINFSNDDYSEIFEKFKYDEEAFIFLDPQYMFSDNWWYEKSYMEHNGHDKKDFIKKRYIYILTDKVSSTQKCIELDRCSRHGGRHCSNSSLDFDFSRQPSQSNAKPDGPWKGEL